MPVTITPHAIIVDGPAVLGFRAVVTRSALELYVATNGRVRPARHVTLSSLLRIASEYTGTTYPRSLAGARQALIDLTAATNRDLDDVQPDGRQG